MSTLPTCDLTDLPRLFCACPEHLNGFTMTDAEREAITTRTIATRPEPTPERRAWVPAHSRTPAQPWAVHEAHNLPKGGLTCQVPDCGRAAGDAFVCPTCLADLDRCLGDTRALIAELEIQELGQSRLSNTLATTPSTGLRFDERARNAKDALWSAIVTGARIITESRNLPLPDNPVAFLLRNLPSIALDPAGPDIVTEVTSAHAHAMRVIDTPPARTYLGLCENCATPMHARRDDHEHQCHTCGAEWNVAERLEHLQAKVLDRLATVGELVDIAAWAGRRVKRKTIDNLIQRGRLSPIATFEGVKRYRVGDLLALLEASAA